MKSPLCTGIVCSSRLGVVSGLNPAPPSLLILLLLLPCLVAPGTARSEEKRRDAGAGGAEGDSGDPDLPGFARGKVDKGKYLRARADWVRGVRGLDTAQPGMREAAIRQMELQERKLGIPREALGAPGLPLGLNPTTWTFVGPNPIPNGQTTDVSTAVSGRVSAIAVDPTDENVVWAGAAGGGVYRSLNGGTNWTPVLDDALTLSVGAIAIAPSDPTIVYVGTGESASGGDTMAGVGVYRITAAKSASPVVSGPFNKNGVQADVMTGRSISRILVHPTDPATIFVATTEGTAGNPDDTTGRTLPARGLFRSRNSTSASPTFAKLTVAKAGDDRAITDLAMEPDNPNNVLAWVVGEAVKDDGGAWRATDAILADAPAFNQMLVSPQDNLRGELAINKVGSTVTVVLASEETTPKAPEGTPGCTVAVQGGVRISTDGGQNWSDAPLQSTRGFCGKQCSYDIYVGIHPWNASRIYLGGAADDAVDPVTKNPCRSAIHQVSTDGGANFTRKSKGLHADSHAIAIALANPETIYVGNDGGIYKSTDGGETWTSLNNALFSATQFQSVAVHPRDPKFTIGGTQDNGTNGMDGAGTWGRIDWGDGGYALIDANAYGTTDVTMYHTYYNAKGDTLGFGRARAASEASDGRWTFLGWQKDGGSNNGIVDQNALFYAPMALGPGKPSTVYWAGDRLYRSGDQGETMEQVSQVFPGSKSEVTAIGVSPQDDNYRLVATTEYQVQPVAPADPIPPSYRIYATTGANPLRNITASLMPGRKISRVVFDPVNKNIAWATFGGFGVASGKHVWKNTDVPGGAGNWIPAGEGIPDVPVDSLVVDPKDSARAYASTDIGVYVTTDGGTNWNPAGSGLPRVPVFDLAIQDQSRTLRIATHGRGIWELQIPGAVTGVVTLELGSYAARSTTRPGDEALVPGDSGTLAASLSDTGNTSATAVSAVLSTATPGVTILNGTSSYPSIAPGATAANSTPFTFTLDPGFRCGQSITFKLTASYSGDAFGPRQYTLVVPTWGAASAPRATRWTGAVAIPESSSTGISIVQAVSGIGGAIRQVRFSLDGTGCSATPGSTTVGLDHTSVGQLGIKLKSPSGTVVTLAVPNTALLKGVNLCNTLFEDGAARAFAEAKPEENPFTGSYRPAEPFSKLLGEDPNGSWTVTVANAQAGGVGTLRAFTIEVTSADCSVAPPQCLRLETAVSPRRAADVTVTTPYNCAGGFRRGTEVGLIAQAKPGYTFATWRGYGGYFASTTTEKTTFTIEGNALATAVLDLRDGTPVVTGVTPSTGPLAGGTPINVKGSGFQKDATVSVGANAAAAVTFVSDKELTATTPAGPAGPADVIVTNPTGGAASLASPGSFLYTVGGKAASMMTLKPCRVIDTRNETGDFGGPALVAGATRSFDLSKAACGIPSGAVGVIMNVTVSDATAPGKLTVYPGNGPSPETATIIFVPGKDRASNASMGLVNGVISVRNWQAEGTVALIVDVGGYYY